MAHKLFPFSSHASRAAHNFRRWRPFFRSNGALRMIFFTSFLLTGLMVYLTFCSSPRRLSDWHHSSYFRPNTPELADPNERPLVDPKLATLVLNHTPESIVPNKPPPQSSSSVSDFLSLEHIRDIVAPTRGFFSRDYSLALGWNNVSGVSCYYV